MKASDIAARERALLSECRLSNRSGSHCGCFRASPGGESDEHIRRKFEVWLELRKRKDAVLTEAIFENGARADVVDLTKGIIYEVTHSEKEQDCREKVKTYPRGAEVRIVTTKEPWSTKLID
jgi:hypothetical protein